MGVLAGICAFDEQRFRDVVLPALRSGNSHPMIAGAIESLWARGLGLAVDYNKFAVDYTKFDNPQPCRYDGLDTVMAHVDEAFTACDLAREFWVVEGVLTGPDEPQDQPRWGYDELVDLVECVITREAIPAWGHLGRTYTPSAVFDYRVPGPDKDTESGSERAKLQNLLVRLDTISWYWIYGGGYSEGVCGWLTAEQTCELATLLPRPDENSANKLSQHCVWTILEWSIDRGLGVLWGRELRLFHEPNRAASLLDKGQTPIVQLA